MSPRCAGAFTFTPVGTLPVKEILATSGWWQRNCPVAAPPCTTLKSPLGTPASVKISANFSTEMGVKGEGLKTIALPKGTQTEAKWVNTQSALGKKKPGRNPPQYNQFVSADLKISPHQRVEETFWLNCLQSKNGQNCISCWERLGRWRCWSCTAAISRDILPWYTAKPSVSFLMHSLSLQHLSCSHFLFLPD